MDQASEEVTLAIEIIRQLENLEYTEETVLQAMAIVCRDTVSKLPEDQQQQWRKYFHEFLVPKPLNPSSPDE